MNTPAARTTVVARRESPKNTLMTPSRTSGLIGAVQPATVLFAAMPAAAHTVRSRPSIGTVVSLDAAGHTVGFSPMSGKAPTELALTRQTKFIHDWHFVPASQSKFGTRAVVYYRTPFFGRPFVTKVVWVSLN